MESGKGRKMKDKSTAVSERTKQVEEAPTEWTWVESSVWTDRMLEALQRGVKGGKWFSLIDKVWSRTTLREAWFRVKANDGAAGYDEVEIADYQRHIKSNLKRVSRKLKEGTYQPQPVRRTWIPKPGRTEKRPLGIPTVEDRVVQTALKMTLEPIFEREFSRHSYGSRPQRGPKGALKEVDQLLKQGQRWVVDADLKSYFDTIDHDLLMERVSEHVSDGRILALIRSFLECEVTDKGETYSPDRGTPQGGVISSLLANIFLNPLDHMMAEEGFEMVRYVDDFVVLCRTEQEAKEALAKVQTWVESQRLTLHPDKTVLVNEADGSFDFLSYRFERGNKFPSKKAKRRFL